VARPERGVRLSKEHDRKKVPEGRARKGGKTLGHRHKDPIKVGKIMGEEGKEKRDPRDKKREEKDKKEDAKVLGISLADLFSSSDAQK